MSTRLIVAAVVGIAAGIITQNPYVGVQAFSLTYGVTGFLDPKQRVLGPKLNDLKAPSASYGAPIAYLEGAPRLAGNFIWASDKREIATTTSQSKGGPGVDSTTYSYEIDALIELAINRCAGIRRVWSNGKLIWSQANTSTSGTLLASRQTNSWRDMRFYNGDPAQLPDPTYEAAVGVGNAPAYRERSTVFIEGMNLGNSGQLPILTFEVVSEGTDAMSAVELARIPQSRSYIGGIPAMSTTEFSMLVAVWDDTSSRIVTIEHWLASPGGVATYQSSIAAPGIYPYTTGKGNSDVSGLLVNDLGSTVFNFVSYGDTGLGYQDFAFTAYDCTAWSVEPSGEYTKFSRRGDIVAIGATSGLDKKLGTFDAVTGFPIANSVSMAQQVRSVATDETYVYALTLDEQQIYKLDVQTMALVATLTPPTLGSVGGSVICDPTGTLIFMTPNNTLDAAQNGALWAWNGATWDLRLEDIGDAVGSADNASFSYDGTTVFSQAFDVDDAVVTSAMPILASTAVTLDQVVRRLCLRTGQLFDADIDVTDLASDIVKGMPISQVSTTRLSIENLMAAYLFEAVEGEKIKFVKRGQASVLTIPYAQLGAGDDGKAEPLSIRRLNDIEQAALVTIRFANVDNDFQDGAESADRLVTASTAVVVHEIPLGLTPTEAKKLADVYTMDLAVALMQIGPVSVAHKYAALEPTDVIVLTGADGSLFRCRIVKVTFGGGIYTFELVLDDATVINSSAVTSAGYVSTTLVRVLASTDVDFLDIPILRDVDDDPGFYAAFGAIGRWPGANLDRSPDNITYTKVADVTDIAVKGVASTVLGDFTGGHVFDEVNTLTVNVGVGTLSSVSRATLLESTSNAMAVGSEANGWEIIQFRSAALLSPGVYLLSGLLRGLRGTEWAIGGHVASERVVLLRLSNGIRRVPDSISDLNVPYYFKAVTFGKSRATTPAEIFTDTGVGLKPFSPVDARLEKAGSGDLTISWKRRTRLATAFSGFVVPLGETSEQYEIEIFEDDTYTTVKRTLSATSESVVYTAAQQTADFGALPAELSIRIYQLGESIGRGYPLQTTLGNDDRLTFVPTISSGPSYSGLALLATSADWLIGLPGSASPGGAAFGFYSFAGSGDAELIGVTLASVSSPYLKDLWIEAHDPATDNFVLLMRGQGSPSGLRKLFYGQMPDSISATVPSFMPANPPFGIWWNGTEFRALLVDGNVWSSPTGQVWADEGASTGGPSTTALNVAAAEIVVVGSKLALKYNNSVLTCADVDGMTWTAATGAVASLPTGTYTTSFVLTGIASNGARGVITALGKMPSDSNTWGLVYSTTDGVDWTEDLEQVVGTSYFRHGGAVSEGLIEFDGNFLTDLWPPLGGSGQGDILLLHTFGGGVTLTYADRESNGRANDGGVVALAGYGSPLGTFFTADLIVRDVVTFTED